jgi:tetratricopeptide (TPR) repeat protein
MKKLFLSLLALVFAGKLFAADVAADFSTANQLYAEGKFFDAASAYENIRLTGVQSPALLFNYANAEFKAGNLGKSIAAYRRAGQLSPHDSEIRANLGFVRNQVQGASVRESFWQSWLGNLSLNEWTVFAALAFWLTFLLLAAKQILLVGQASRLSSQNPNATGRMPVPLLLRRAAFVCGALTIFSGTILGVQAANHFSKRTAVVISAQATARSGPFDDAQNAFAIHDGVELSVLDRRDGWVQVQDGAGKSGWLPEKQVEVLPGA